ncbi:MULTISPECIES: CDP-alcohol phosphatidyltransferase family protein [unclassified Aeromicrobium]|uniref:CDP-alcohol phosphatidyltransferase family protein n=1 Tax=unclassified Aeromicrobium TaxID=2633570 RepID=UPI00396B0DCB
MSQVQIEPRNLLSAANLVTGSRFVLAAAVAVVALLDGPGWLLGALAGAALISDFVDGRVARGLGTVTPLGARLDQEADALLILVLSAVVAADLGAWVLGVGMAHYAFGALFRLVPPLRTPPARPRYWCKVVAASVGIVLAVVAAVPLPTAVATALVVGVALLLAESFLRETVDRWRSPRPPERPRVATVVAFVVVWAALVLPTDREHLTAAVLLRLPLEVLLVVGLALLPWRRTRTAGAALAGLLLAVVALATALDLGFHAVFDRWFDPVGDWSYLGPGVGVLGDSIGTGWALGVAALAAVAAVAVLVGLPLAVVRLVAVAREHRRPAVATATSFALVWALLAVTGMPVAAAGAADLTAAEVDAVRAGLADRRAFARQIAADPVAAARHDPASLLSGLVGKDVLLVFVESYGRVAVEGTTYATGITEVLDDGSAALDAAGYRSRSAFLTSPTFGGGSWLAHASVQSGLWVDSQRRYRQLLRTDRLTLTRLFGRAGWHTVLDVPANTADWPEGRDFYRFQRLLDSRTVGYRGPRFGYSRVPDQYTLEHFRRAVLTSGARKPVMAEIDLTSSHHPWTPLPSLIAWDRIGDGSVYDTMRQSSPSPVLRDQPAVSARYGESIEYTWRTLVSFLTTYRDPNLVLVVLGDHQPHASVSGDSPGHDVPISVIASDPAVLERIDGWRWTPGLRPAPDAPVWRMDAFRDRFLTAFGARR